MPPADPSTDPADDGTRVLEWLASDEARQAARGYLRRAAFPPTAELVDDVVGDATLNGVKRQASNPLTVANPAAYGTTVIRNVVHGLTRHEIDYLADEGELEGEPMVGDPFDDPAADDVRVIIERVASSPWLTAAALTYLTLLMHPTAVPDHAPAPKAGSRPDQARAWPALWFAGHRDLFPDPCPERVRRRRGRYITELLGLLADVFAEYRLELERIDG